MKVTLSVLKADIGSIGGHTLPSRKVLAQVEGVVREAVGRLLLDAHVFHIGDDIVLLLSHAQGPRNPAVHELAWKAFQEGTRVAKEEGLYGAGQDLLKDAFSGNLHGLGPQVAEMEFEERPAEPFMVLAADKTEPGAFNLPLYLAFADPMYSSGLLLSPDLRPGFRFRIMDLAQTERDSYIVLDAPERLYDIAALLRDSHRFGIESIWSRRYGEIAAVVSTTRLRNIAGRYVGKDDPVAIVRTQKIFPATEEFGPPFALAPFVAGDTRGSHHLPLMPVRANTPASTFFCVPMVCGLAFSLKEGRLSEPVDLFADPVWDAVRAKAVAKAQEMRRQGFYGPAMLPMEELEYTGIAERLRELEREFS
ncbi:fructose-1,6-bisphosphate aldolase/phosphatase [Thermus albus]|uniref:fructose-1,6-bisphosphate aldolase/phosphatase n=1 Tax=Thermus albus TaxID=2908146 RepID=UPI001FA97F2C|nr:fructose-1,6-bisphosphate aldolase/phosphatase [Thermus albus]